MKSLIYSMLYILSAFAYIKDSYSSLLTSKIKGGENVVDEAKKFVVRIENINDKIPYHGAVISVSHVISLAAPFVAADSKTLGKYLIQMGSISLIMFTQINMIAKVFYHPDYDFTTQPFPNANFAVILMLDKIDTRTVSIINLESKEILPSNNMATVFGWGIKNLMKRSVQIADYSSLSPYCNFPMSAYSQIIAFAQPNNVRVLTHGDDGAPLVVDENLAGIAHGIPHQEGHYNLFTNISHYHEFINAIINNDYRGKFQVKVSMATPDQKLREEHIFTTSLAMTAGRTSRIKCFGILRK